MRDPLLPAQVFDGDVASVVSSLLECIAACQDWRRLYDETVAAVAANPGQRRRLWSFDVTSIFAQVDAFVQRCRDLQEVCEGQVQFARRCGPGAAKTPLPPFGGSRGLDIQRSLQTIDEEFTSYVAGLRAMQGEILNVKATGWHEQNNAFKGVVKDLEVVMANVINEAFSGVTSVSTAVELLEAFSSLAKRPAVQRAVDKKTIEVFQLYAKQVADVKAYFEANSAAPPVRWDEPRHSGAALWARGLQLRLERDWRLLASAQHYLCPCKAATDVAEAHEKLMASFEDYARARYGEWMEEMSSIDASKVTAQLNQPLLSRCATLHTGDDAPATAASAAAAKTAKAPGAAAAAAGGPYLRSNFDKRILGMLSEVHGWEKFDGK